MFAASANKGSAIAASVIAISGKRNAGSKSSACVTYILTLCFMIQRLRLRQFGGPETVRQSWIDRLTVVPVLGPLENGIQL